MDAAVNLAEGSLGPVLEKLQVLGAACSNIIGVRSQILILQSELTSMQAVLCKVAAMEDDHVDIQVRAWTQEVRELAYDVEDCVDAFTQRQRLAGGQGQGGGMVKRFFQTCSRFLEMIRSWHQFANRIKELKTQAVEVSERRERYRLDDLVPCAEFSGSLGVDPRLCALFAGEDRLVSISGPRDAIAQSLLEGGTAGNLKVLSIVGSGGLGKTTLANQVCKKIDANFNCKAFVSVSQKPNVKQILRDCLGQLHKGLSIEDIWDEKKLITEIRDYLADKRYLVVIDDVWSTSAWDAISCSFPENSCSSRIITTTRINDVAGSCSSHVDGQIYRMEPLDYHCSRSLFMRRIFGSEDCPDQFREVSDEILKKCGGVPLAILSISGLLSNKPAVKEEWEKVVNSIGTALEKDGNLEGLKSILNLSYNDLPPQLRTCLLYLSVFPEDFLIKRNRLVNRWIAEGLIPLERGQSSQSVAERYFYELINRSIVEPIHVGYEGKARGCQVHDIMLEIIISKATEQNLVSIIGSQGSAVNPPCKIRRLSIQQTEEEVVSDLGGKDLSHVRSLTVYGSMRYLPHLVQFDVLRVLDLEGCRGLEDYDLSKIDKLSQLMFLSLRNTGIATVPSEIVKLHDLETLDLRGNKIVELPAGIVQLKRLQHLMTADYDRGMTKVPDGIGSMKNLLVLSGFNIGKSSANAVDELSKLTSLKELHIQLNAPRDDISNRHEEVLRSSLCKLGNCRLQSLWVYSSNSSPMEFLEPWTPLPLSLRRFRMTTNYFFPRIPNWITPALRSLAYLNINLFDVTQEDLDILGELQALIYLELYFHRDLTERLTVRSRGFQCLKEFKFKNDLSRPAGYLVFETGALPQLENVTLSFSVSMAKGSDFYLGIKHLPCLKYAVVQLCNKRATSPESKMAADAIRNEANSHPNNPRVYILGEV